ncbi:MAG: protein hesA, partial [Nostoc sp.]
RSCPVCGNSAPWRHAQSNSMEPTGIAQNSH